MSEDDNDSIILYILAHYWETVCFIIITFAFFISIFELIRATRPRPTLNSGCCDYYKRSFLQGALYEECTNTANGKRDERRGTERATTYQNRQGTHLTTTNKNFPPSTLPVKHHRWRLYQVIEKIWPQEDLMKLMYLQARINLMKNAGTDGKGNTA
ncbi:hypothetical protein HF086_014445 [Spodoptera exigua]|uniref:Uncharacterized protein n=1 Tax=Spodoptera exigua TaxID=7107 RepID=A0A922MQ29_SPOEX|nr:hypothetical protein HF086_014445 [Spodoptera exigua]